jgi:hypothetical protein
VWSIVITVDEMSRTNFYVQYINMKATEGKQNNHTGVSQLDEAHLARDQRRPFLSKITGISAIRLFSNSLSIK